MLSSDKKFLRYCVGGCWKTGRLLTEHEYIDKATALFEVEVYTQNQAIDTVWLKTIEVTEVEVEMQSWSKA